MIEEGKPAPDFELTTDEGSTLRLSSLRGNPVVLYFYPRDDTPGCTVQACGIRDAYDAFSEQGARVLGVSVDGESSHARFRAKYGLPFTLLADPEAKAGELYGVVQPGKETFERSTFVIDSEGRVAKILRHVTPDEHVEQVSAALLALAP